MVAMFNLFSASFCFGAMVFGALVNEPVYAAISGACFIFNFGLALNGFLSRLET